jgi:hypothetical protein
MKKNWPVLLVAILAASLFCEVAPAVVPPVLNHQGMLTDAAGTPLAGDFSITFRLYEVIENGTPIWSEMQLVPVAGGVFNVYLGSVTPLDDELFVGQEIYLGVTVESDSEMTPRLRLGSVLYAFTANRDAATPPTWYHDGDGDTYGDPVDWTTAFTTPSGYVGNNLDCDDGDPGVHPGATELDCDGVDHDCDGFDANGINGPPCPLQIGVCAGSTMPCIDGAWGPCGENEFGPLYESFETSCDGRDNDCDGATDENADCDDGNPCTVDLCDGNGGCLNYPLSCDDGLPCTEDVCMEGECIREPLPGTCVIGGACYEQYEKNPINECQECQPWVDTYAWTNAADGTPCADGTCAQGNCVPLKNR